MKAKLNADVGEGAGFDELLIPLVGMTNICCGAHAGGKAEMLRATRLALQHQSQIGAHPGYADRTHFGRKEHNLSPQALQNLLHKQLSALNQTVQDEGGELSYIKPHGALYNQMARSYTFSLEVIQHLLAWQPLPIMVLANSPAVNAGRDLDATIISEGFMDRTYTSTGQLVSRSSTSALISTPQQAQAQAYALLTGKPFPSVTGEPLTIKAETICVHGDSKHALTLLHAVNSIW